MPRSISIRLRRQRLLPAWVRRIDQRAAQRRNGTRLPAAVDAGLRGLSRRADRGVLWFALAGVLVLLGKRRAAVRGLASLSVASIIANLVGKELFGGDRPILDDVPVTRRLHRPPTSPSFPSGHSASAAAFALGAAIETPATALVTAPLAAGVAYSRLHTGSHWLSDVIGGVTIGAAVAGLGRLLVRPRERGPAGTPVALPALRRGRGLFLVVNRASGSGSLRLAHPAVIPPSSSAHCPTPFCTFSSRMRMSRRCSSAASASTVPWRSVRAGETARSGSPQGSRWPTIFPSSPCPGARSTTSPGRRE